MRRHPGSSDHQRPEGPPTYPKARDQDFVSTNWRHPWDLNSKLPRVLNDMSYTRTDHTVESRRGRQQQPRPSTKFTRPNPEPHLLT
ncbi:hypothetical protein Tco_1307236 [Tanacetum coccineum]